MSKLELLPYQKEDVDQMVRTGARTLLSSDPGLGKTIESLAVIFRLMKFPAIIICPQGLKRQWEQELWNNFKVRATVLYGSENRRARNLKTGKVYIVNYEILHKWIGWLRKKNPQFIAIDEVHLIGNASTLRSRAVVKICQGVKHIIGISGTPLTNRTWELFPILNIIWPQRFNSPFVFGNKYCIADKDFGKWRFQGSKNTKQLHDTLIKCGMIRRTRAEVLPQLPPKRRIIVPFDIENRAEYDRAERDLIGWLAETNMEAAIRAAKAIRYTKFGYLLRLSAMGKMKWVFEWLDNYLNDTDTKMLIGAKHRIKTPIIPMLYERYKDVSVQIHGGMTAKQKYEAEQRFRQDSTVRFCIGQEQAAGVGLNMPEAPHAAMVEFPWTPGACKQFEDRIYRLTSKSPVTVWYFPAFGTVEEKLFEIIQRKERILDQVLDGVDVQESSLTIWDELQAMLVGGAV